MNFDADFFGAIPPISLLSDIALDDYCKIDLSVNNLELADYDLSDAKQCQWYIDRVLSKNNAIVAYGGYLEERNLYKGSERFKGSEERNIHLGMDFWCMAGTTVLTPIDGIVHSFANNADFGNYGPTIILKHKLPQVEIHTLYGHLSLESFQDLYVGKEFKAGEPLATLGETHINVGYAPHLHFQLVLDMGNSLGDYPGVCSKKDFEHYHNNCPNPNLLLALSA